MLRSNREIDFIIGTERETRRRRIVARNVAKTARRAGNMGMYGGGISTSGVSTCVLIVTVAL